MMRTELPPSSVGTPSPLRHRWKVLAAGVVANAAFSVAFSGIPMTAVLMRAGYHLDNATLGLILGLMGLGIALSELPWGMLTDRWGDRPVLLTGLTSTALALAAMGRWAAPKSGQIPALGWLAGGLLLVGLLGGSVNGASGRAVMNWFADGERGLAMSIRQTAVPLGGAIGALLLPALALHLGFAAMYAFLAALCVLGALLVWAWVHEPPSAARAARPATDEITDARAGPLRDPRIWRIVAAIGILCAPQFAVLSFGTIFLHDVGHAGLVVITATMVFVQIGAMVLRVWSGRWTDRHRNRPTYLRTCGALTGLLFMTLAAAALAGDGSLLAPLALRVVLILMLAAGGVCVSAWHGVAYAELATLAGAARSGTALGMANTSVFVVCFLTPLAIPYMLAVHGWALIWLVGGICALVATPLFAPSTLLAKARESGSQRPRSNQGRGRNA